MAGKKMKGGEIVLRVTQNGLEVIDKKADKASKSLKRTGQSAHSADRALKGAAQASSGASKNFSKMSQGITGGLVPAYATLAANLFAVDALFRFLKSSADFRVLTQGQLAFAAATGVAYKSLAKDLQAATKNMINFRDAAQAGAIGRAAGLSAGQLRELSEAAFTVSMALGRDVTDSFNRLVRGVTKAEPELLDELGIVLRLEEATTKYAASLGLNKNQLSIYQKSQAVVNEVLDQAERKFGKINEIMEPSANSIAQLGVAAEGAIDSLRPIISALAEPVADFFKNNVNATITALGLFATSILRSVIPSIGDLRIKQAEQAQAHIDDLNRMQQEYDELLLKKKKLGGTPIAQDRAKKSLGKKRLGQIGGESARKLERGEALTNREVGAIKAQITKNQADLGVSDKLKNKIFKDLDQIKGKSSATTQKMKLDFKTFGTSARMQFNKLKQAALPVFASLERGFQRVTMALSGLMTAVAYIGMAILAFQLLKSAYDKFFGPDQSQVDQFNKRFDSLRESVSGLNQELLKMGEVRQRGLITGDADTALHTFEALQSASLSQNLAKFEQLAGRAHLNREAFEEISQEMGITFTALGDLDERFNEFGDTLRKGQVLSDAQKKSLTALTDEILKTGSAFKQLKEVEGELIKEQNRFVQSLPKIPFQNMLTLIQQQEEAYQDLVENGMKQYQGDLDLASAKLEYYTELQKTAIAFTIEEQKLLRVSKFSFLAGFNQKTLNVQKEQLKLKKMEFDLVKMENSIKESNLGKDSKALANTEQQILVQKELIKTQKLAYEAAKMQANDVFMLYNNLYKGLQNDFANAISQSLQGKGSGAFEKIGENFQATIADAMGKFVSEKFMVNLVPKELRPMDIADKIRDGGDYHAQEVQLAIESGGKYHADSISQVATAQIKSMDSIVTQMIKANQSVNTRKMNELTAEEKRLAKMSDKALKMSTTEGIGAMVGTDEFNANALSYAKSQMSAGQYASYVRALADKKFAQDRLAALPGEAKDSPTGSVRIYDDSMPITLKNAQRQMNNKIDDADREIQAALGEDYIDLYFQFLNSRTMQAEEEYNQYQKRLKDIGIEKGILEKEGTQLGEDLKNVGSGGLPGKVEEGTLTKALKNQSGDGEKKTELTEAQKNTIANIELQMEQSEKFGETIGQFGTITGIFGMVAGENEKTAKVMAAVAKIQMGVALFEQVLIAKKAAVEGKSFIKAFLGFGGRQGGIMSRHGRSYSQGGIADGPTAGYPAVLHGREAVVPLPNGRSIPVDIGKQQMGNNNVSININMDEGTSDTKSDAEDAKALGQAINTAVLQVIEREQRQGGLLGN